jgi:hypothetical protein
MYTPSKTLLYTFITFGFAAIVSLAMRDANSFIFTSSIADVLGIYMAVKTFKS